MQTTFAEVDWTTERMIVLECGHVFTAETLDGLMGVCLFPYFTFNKVLYTNHNSQLTINNCKFQFPKMESVYHMDALGNWLGIKPITEQPGELKRCPNCRSPIKNIQRYGRIIKK